MPYGETQSETWQEDFTLIPRHFEFMFLYSEMEGSRSSDSFARKGCFLCSLETWGMIILIRNNQDASCWDTLPAVCVLPQDTRVCHAAQWAERFGSTHSHRTAHLLSFVF